MNLEVKAGGGGGGKIDDTSKSLVTIKDFNEEE